MKALSVLCLLTIPFALGQTGTVSLGDIQQVDVHTPRDLQIRLAESTAPSAISSRANVYVLGSHGYELARAGSNGFSCLVSRQRTDTVEPECFDAEGSATTLKARLFVEKLRSSGMSEERITAAVKLGYKQKRFIAPRRAGIVYMLSDHNFVFDPSEKRVVHFPGHLMFYAPYLTAKEIGDAPGAPYLTHPGAPDNLMVVVPRGHLAP
jgi:hypothetical protein